MGQIPTGAIIAYGATVNPSQQIEPPLGWLLCDGSAVPRATYATLFAAIGTVHGQGDGQTTFNLPDYRGRFLRAVDGGVGRDMYANQRYAPNVGGNAGDNVGSIENNYTAAPVTPFSTDTQGDHNHYVSHLPTDSSWYEIAGSHYAEWNADSVTSGSGGAHSHASSAGGDAESRPINLYVNFLIYADYFPS